jgi:anti-sigma factor RsiW
MSDARLKQLIDKALDGELSAVEREELDRLLRMHPEGRRSLVFWQRFDGAISEALDRGPKLDVARMTKRVMSEQDRGAPRRIASRIELVRPWLAAIRRPAFSRVLIVGSSLAMIAALVWSNVSSRGERISERAPASSVLGVVVTAIADEATERRDTPSIANLKAPVEIHLDEPGANGQRESAPVTIRF